MMLVRGVSSVEKAMIERDGYLLDQGESELMHCIATTKRAFGQHSGEVGIFFLFFLPLKLDKTFQH